MEHIMPKLYAYTKKSDQITTHYIKLPEAAQGEQAAQELATLPDGRTVVVLFDGYTLPANQPAEIAASIEQLGSPLEPELRAQVMAASPAVRLTYERTQALIRSKYSVDDEAYFARIGVGVALGAYTFEPGEQEELLAFGSFVESARAWGRAERAKLGL
jgi:hypothetical protein